MATKAGAPPSSATSTPRAAADEVDASAGGLLVGSARLWVQEPGQPITWHTATERIAYHWYRMACGWEVRLVDAQGVWPAKGGEPQPPPRTRCRSCEQMHEVTMLLGGPLFGQGARRAAARS